MNHMYKRDPMKTTDYFVLKTHLLFIIAIIIENKLDLVPLLTAL